LRKSLFWIFILIAFLVSLTVRSGSTASPKPFVCVDPKMSWGLAGTTLTINVNVTNVDAAQALYSYDINLTFNPSILHCAGVAEGPFLKKAGDTWWYEPDIRNDKGYVLFGASLYWMMPPPPPGASGNGTLGTITFNVLKDGKSHLNFSMTALNTLVNEGGTWVSQPIAQDPPQNGVFTIPGDVNGNGTVDVSDLFSLSKAYGSTSSSANWNPNCDFNRDRKVDVSDLRDLSKNYGKS